MADIKLKVQKRDTVGRKVKRLRREGLLPGNIFGKKIESLSIQTDLIGFEKVFEEAGETSIVSVDVDGEKGARPVLISNIQFDPVTSKAIHADFHQIDLKEKVTANVPVELIGESLAEKQGLGTVVQYINEIEVEALPADLPEKFEVDVTELDEVDKAFLVNDLKIDKDKVEIKNEAEEILAKVEPPQKEEEPEPVEPVEGEEPAEGEEVEGGEGESEEADKSEEAKKEE